MEEQRKPQRPANAKHKPADGSAPRKRRPANAEGEVPRKRRPVDAEGEAPRKRRPVDAEGEAPRKRRPVDAEGEAPRKRRPADAEGAAPRKRRPADAEGEAPRKRRPADAEGTAPRKRRPADAEGTAPRKRRPADAEGAAPRKRRPQDAHRPANRNAAARRNAQHRGQRRQAEASASIPQLSWAMFLIFAVIYIVVGVLYINNKVENANSYLAEMEESRPQYKMDDYISHLSDAFFSDMLAKAADGLTVSEYETTEMLEEALHAVPDDSAKYSYEKAEDFSESRPRYYITRNGEAVAAATLERTGWTPQHNFPVWQVGMPESLIEVTAQPEYTVAVTVPQDATVKLNGVTVPEEKFTEAPSELQLTPTELMYMAQPVSKSCEIEGLYLVPTVEVTDAKGNVLTPETVPDSKDARQEFVFAHADEKTPDEALLARVHDLTLSYMDYTINTRCTIDENLADLSNYMLPGSPFAVLMQKIYSDIWYNNDPNMREDHVYEVRHVRMYADNLCTVDVHLESTIGKVAVNDYIGTVRWVLVNNGYNWYVSNFTLMP